MTWPTPLVRLLGAATGTTANPSVATVNFTAQPAGTLLLAYDSAGRGGPAFTVVTSGWTLLDQVKWDSGSTAPSFGVWARIADGTETSLVVSAGSIAIAAGSRLHVIAIDAQSGLAGFGGVLDQAVHRSSNFPAFTMPYTPDTLTTVGSPTLRVDFVGGNQAVSAPFTSTDPGNVDLLDTAAQAGDANRGAASIFARLLPDSGPGSSVPGSPYTASVNSVAGVQSILVRIPTSGWKINEMGFA